MLCHDEEKVNLQINMEKYVTSIKDFVIQTITNGSEIKANAESGDALSCFQMGMIYLLGINTSVDFKKASQYFGSQTLADNQDAIRLLGFIAECRGNYSQAFQYYAKTESSENDSYLDKVIKGRNHVQDYLKKLDLPITLNKEISSILSNYSKDKSSRKDASIKIAALCEDESTCLEAATYLYEAKDYISAIQWLKKGNISADNSMYIAINDTFEKSRSNLLKSKAIQILDLNTNSLLSQEDPTPFLNKVKKTCDDASMNSSKEWETKVKSIIGSIIKKHKDKEHKAYLEALAEEEAKKKRKNNTIKYVAIAISVVFFVILGAIISNSEEKEKNVEHVNQEINKSEKQERDKSKEEKYSGYDNTLSERKLLDEDLAYKSKKELEIMRNSIYARYGYKFKRADLYTHFSQYSWYNPTTDDTKIIYNKMNDNEKYNIEFIKKHE